MAVQKNPNTPHAAVAFSRELLHPRYVLTWLGLAVAAFLSLLPQSVRHGLGNWVGDYLYRSNKKRADVAYKNLRQVFPDAQAEQLQHHVRLHLRWYAKGLLDYSVFFFATRKRLQAHVSIVNEAYLQLLKQQEQPVILLLAHSVMLEFAAVALSKQGYQSFGSYKRSNNPVLDWIIAKSRCRFVDFVVSREQGLRPLLKAIRSQRIMIFLPDEDLGLDNAVFAPFFNRQKATLTTAARLCKLGKAKAVAGFVAFDSQQQCYQLRLEELPSHYPLGEAESDAKAMNQAFEQLILQSPEQYMWLMKFYKTTRPEDMVLY